MNLSEISGLSGKLIQDTDFGTVGSIYSRKKNRIVPVLNDNELAEALNRRDISGIIIPPELHQNFPENLGIIESDNPYRTALLVDSLLNQPDFLSGSPSIIDKSAKIHQSAEIAPSGVKIGPKSKIDANVRIKEGVSIGRHVVIGPNTVIGTLPDAGYDISKESPGFFLGKVTISDNTQIHANACLKRPVFSDETAIGADCHIDSQAGIFEGVTIGNATLIAAIVTIGAYAGIGEECWAGPRCIINPGVEIGNSCHITLGSIVTKNISNGMMVKDNWAIRKDRFKGIIP